MLLPVLLASLSSFDASLPQVIDISTPTQATDLFGDYALDGGLLYQRKKPEEPWKLVDGIGLPNLDGKVLPEVKGKLTRVFADGNVVAVVDEHDQVFRFDTSLAVLNLEPTLYAWRAAWSTRPLVLRKDLRSISYGRRTILNVGVVEDRFGYKLLAANPSSLISVFHENGFSGLMHFYGLSQDGKRLYFADNGLTDVFNYEFDLPTAEDFVGVAVASSGSMVVVLDSKGRFWAKFLDFDWYGSNPMMFEYSYVNESTAKTDADLEGFGRIHLPLPTWRELPPLTLPPNAFFSTEMGMAVTGHDNNARELRVRGADEHGSCGLWVIDLDKNRWSFRATGICAKERFVAETDVPKTRRTTSLSGVLSIGGRKIVATVDGYSLVDSPARLTLRDAASGEVDFRGALYLVPAWSPLEIQDPGRDGRYKMFYATVEADAGFESSGFAREHNLKAFDLTAYGAENELVLKPLRDDVLWGRLGDESSDFRDEVAAGLFRSSEVRGVAGACRDLAARVGADEGELLKMTSATPALNAFGLVTGTRFWYYHGVSMIPPLGRMMDWGTRLIYDRYEMTKYEKKLVERHCGTARPER